MQTTKLITILVGVLFLTGCTPQNCPTITCPACKQADQDVPISETLFVHAIDVGQGDATLIKQGDAEMLIDCGRQGAGPAVVDFLKQRQVGTLEFLLVTHPDSDHLGGCDEVIKEFSVQTIITNGQIVDNVNYQNLLESLSTERQLIANEGDEWFIGAALIKVLQSNNGLSDTNANSVVTKLSYGSMDVLLTGDCDRQCEDLLFTKSVDSEILKVAHHGSKFGTELDFLEKVNPQLALIHVGVNSYGHPAPQLLDRLSQEGVLVYRTDLDGDITLKLSKEGYEVIT